MIPATCKMDCPSCGREYEDFAALKDDLSRLCETCLKEVADLRIDEAVNSPPPQPEKQP